MLPPTVPALRICGVPTSPAAAATAEYTFAICACSARSTIFTPAPIFHGELANLHDGLTYDALTYWDVLEHLPDPRAELQLARERLNPGGVAGVSLPSVQGLKARLQRDAWRYYAPSMGHISHFTPKTLSLLLSQADFTVLEVRTHGAANLWKFLGEDPLSVRQSRPALHAIQHLADNTAGELGLGETITALARR